MTGHPRGGFSARMEATESEPGAEVDGGVGFPPAILFENNPTGTAGNTDEQDEEGPFFHSSRSGLTTA